MKRSISELEFKVESIKLELKLAKRLEKLRKRQEKEKEMTKKDLKNGMIVETREGTRYLYCDGVIRGLDGWNVISNYTDNLNNTQFRNLDIVKVYEDTRKYSLDLIFKYEYLKLIWETPKLSEREIEILKSLDALGFTHIARDKGGNIFAYKHKPIKDSEIWFFNNPFHYDETKLIKLKKELFTFITWADKEPTNISNLLLILNRGEKK